jgi:predicted component of type VI protein secretion system
MELRLTWLEGGIQRLQTVSSDRLFQRAVKVGRDPLRSEIVINNPTVSGLHVAIYFDPVAEQFLISNLRQTNPPLVNGKKLQQEPMSLSHNCRLQLGEVMVTVQVHQTTPDNAEYGLKCPNLKCGKVSPYDSLKLVCPWCGTSLASAQSVIISQP